MTAYEARVNRYCLFNDVIYYLDVLYTEHEHEITRI